MSDLIAIVADDRITFSLYSETYKRYVFVSNDKKGGDNIVEAHPYIEARNTFVLEAAGDSLYRIRNIQYGRYLFVSNDSAGRDKIVEAHLYEWEERNLFSFSQNPDGTFLIRNHSTGMYLFVSNDTKGSDNVVEAHSPNYKYEPRNKFTIQLNYNYKRWMEKNMGLREKTLSEICLPASHDSGAFALKNKVVEKDSLYALVEEKCESIIHDWPTEYPLPVGDIATWVQNEILYPTVRSLAKATHFSISDQLADGIRCLDLRVCYDSETDDFYLYHGLIGTKLSVALTQIKEFLCSTAGELVYVTIGHWRNFPDNRKDIWSRLNNQLVDAFSERIYKPEFYDGKICNNPLGTTFSLIIGSTGQVQSTVIFVAGDDNSLDPSLFFPSAFSPPDNGMNGTIIHGCYTNTSNRPFMILDQSNNWKSNTKNLPFALYLTLTPDKESIGEIAGHNAAQALSMVMGWGFLPSQAYMAIVNIIRLLRAKESLEWTTLYELSQIANENMVTTITSYFQKLVTNHNKISFLYVDYYHDTSAVDIAIALSGGNSTPELSFGRSRQCDGRVI